MIEDIFKEVFMNAVPENRNIKIMTGVWGMDFFEEEVGFQTGSKKRLYIGKKVPRILRRLKTPIYKSEYTGRFYKLLNPSQL